MGYSAVNFSAITHSMIEKNMGRSKIVNIDIVCHVSKLLLFWYHIFEKLKILYLRFKFTKRLVNLRPGIDCFSFAVWFHAYRSSGC